MEETSQDLVRRTSNFEDRLRRDHEVAVEPDFCPLYNGEDEQGTSTNSGAKMNSGRGIDPARGPIQHKAESVAPRRRLRGGMVGMGMIFDETYRPFFEQAEERGVHDRCFGDVDVLLTAVASRTGTRAEKYLQSTGNRAQGLKSFSGADAVSAMLGSGVDFACVATPDDRHFDAARAILQAGVHVLIEKPSVLRLQELDELLTLADEKHVLAKVVYHKLLDPDHKKLRTLVADGVLRHVNHGYCSLLEPKQISGAQFAEWIHGRNPGTYVAVHYIKLIDFSFPGRLKTVTATGHAGLSHRKTGRPGTVASAADLRIRLGPGGGFRYSHLVGHTR